MDPFNEPYQQAVQPPNPNEPMTNPTFPPPNPALSSLPNPNAPYPAAPYAPSPYPYSSFAPPYPYGPYQRHSPLQTATQASQVVLSNMQHALHRFARVSSLIEDVLRHLHMLFDAVFGLIYSISAARQEVSLWLSAKTPPAAWMRRLLRKVSAIWKVLCVFFVSPLAGRFSPVALVLRILGLVPNESGMGYVVEELWREAHAGGENVEVESSNM